MGKFTYDVEIVGASIAGCTAAILFARTGARVALIERNKNLSAYKKICTHFIQASATPTIERLGLTSRIEAAGGIRNDAELWTRWGWIREPGGLASYGYNIRREKLDPMVREQAANSSGVDLMPGYSVQELSIERDRPVGVWAENSCSVRLAISARLLVGADGRNSRVAKLAGIQARVKPHRRFAYFAHYRDLPLASRSVSQMWFLEPDVAERLVAAERCSGDTMAPLGVSR